MATGAGWEETSHPWVVGVALGTRVILFQVRSAPGGGEGGGIRPQTFGSALALELR